MELGWLAAYLVLLLSAVAQALLLGLHTWEHRRYARSCIRRVGSLGARGHVAMFAPCKGLDVDLEENLRGLFRQDYDDYELVFIVESEEDAACPAIRRVMAEHPSVPSRLVVAGRATTEGQKVHNLRVATADLPPMIRYLAFVDSDACPRPEWLRSLVAMLTTRTGAVTGYRWFVPVRPSIGNYLVYSMNCDVMTLLSRSSYHLIWGGSWGIRRDLFDSIGLHDAWQGVLSDDLVASRTLRRAGLSVRFEPACVVPSPLDYSLTEMFGFIRRQYLMTRLYTPNWLTLALAAATFSNLVWIASIAAVAAAIGWDVMPASVPIGGSLAFYLLGVVRRAMRQDLIRTYFPDRLDCLRRARRFDIWAGPLVGLVDWLAIVGSLLGRNVRWRGIRYRISTEGTVESLERDDGLPDVPPMTTPLCETLFRKAG
jgi:cellulose synthase/poly-beta-1,6-N-acetylglucosamine synthase-like glycosyltransferase